jgi:negative regulator of sigma E activity
LILTIGKGLLPNRTKSSFSETACSNLYAGGVKAIARALCLVLIVFASSRLDAEDDLDLSALLKPTFAKLGKASQSKTRFTYFDLNHLQNFNEKGKKFVDVTQLFEVTYIGDLQYARLVEVDGKPLAGKELKKEQERYDQAVRDHSALDDTARAKIQHREMKKFDVNLDHFSSQYRSSITGREDVNGRECVLIDATPLADAPQRHFRIWIDPAKEEMLQMETTLLADDQDKMSGSKVTQGWIFIDDVPLVSESHFDTRILVGKKQIHVISDHAYSRFRKFSVSTTILPFAPEGKP